METLPLGKKIERGRLVMYQVLNINNVESGLDQSCGQGFLCVFTYSACDLMSQFCVVYSCESP